MPELNLILLGPPGSGKGTQGERLQEDHRLPYFATGDILRAAVRDGTDIGKQAGRSTWTAATSSQTRCRRYRRAASVGRGRRRIHPRRLPRTVPQAEALDARMKELHREMTAAVLIEVSEDEMVRRLGGRRTCEAEGHVFHVEFNLPKEEGVCDIDGSKLIVRDDDKPEVIKHRLEQYREKTEPLIDYYEDRGILHRIPGEQPPDEVEERINGLLATLRREDEMEM